MSSSAASVSAGMSSLIITNPTNRSPPSWTDHIRGHALASVDRVLEMALHRAEEALLARRRDEPEHGGPVRVGDDVAQLDRGHGRRRPTRTAGVADLVEERERAGFALERGPDEVAQRGLDLALDARRDWRRPAIASMSSRW